MGERRCVYKFWCGNLREIDHLGDPGVDESIMLSWIFRKLFGWGACTGLICLRIGTAGMLF
jgi:hypothetical protein